MSIKTVLALADSSITVESTLTSAVAVARRFGAHLEALHVRPDPADFVPVMAGRIPAQMVEQLMANKQAESAENRNKARAAYESICLSSGLSTGWQEATGWEPETLARAGRFADLLAVAKRDGEMSETIEAALFDSGRPILVLTGIKLLVQRNADRQEGTAPDGGEEEQSRPGAGSEALLCHVRRMACQAGRTRPDPCAKGKPRPCMIFRDGGDQPAGAGAGAGRGRRASAQMFR